MKVDELRAPIARAIPPVGNTVISLSSFIPFRRFMVIV
jgi:hypothetical protein